MENKSFKVMKIINKILVFITLISMFVTMRISNNIKLDKKFYIISIVLMGLLIISTTIQKAYEQIHIKEKKKTNKRVKIPFIYIILIIISIGMIVYSEYTRFINEGNYNNIMIKEGIIREIKNDKLVVTIKENDDTKSIYINKPLLYKFKVEDEIELVRDNNSYKFYDKKLYLRIFIPSISLLTLTIILILIKVQSGRIKWK